MEMKDYSCRDMYVISVSAWLLIQNNDTFDARRKKKERIRDLQKEE